MCCAVGIDVVAVVGACLPERRRCAASLAEINVMSLITADQLRGHRDPVVAAAREAQLGEAVIEFPDGVSLPRVIGALADPEGPTRLVEIICVVDAAHLIADLRGMDTVTEPVGDGPAPVRFTTRARAVCAQLEYASTVVVVGWRNTADLDVVLALIAHLGPQVRIELDAGVGVVLDRERPYTVDQDRSGWMALLSDDLSPLHAHPRVQAFRYEQVRPLHPERLLATLDAISGEHYGTVLRSSGFCRLATRPGVVAQWDHVGTVIAFDPVAVDTADEEVLAIGQDLGIIGVDLDVTALTLALDAAALDDGELLAGPRRWRELRDPLPAWPDPSRR